MSTARTGGRTGGGESREQPHNVVAAIAVTPAFLLLACRVGAEPEKLMIGTPDEKASGIHLEALPCPHDAGVSFDAVLAICSSDPLPGDISVIDSSGSTILGPISVASMNRRVSDFVRLGPGALDALMRQRVLQVAIAAYGRCGTAGEPLEQRLHDLREALRERLPHAIPDAQEPRALHIDTVVAADSTGFYIQGWLHHPAGLHPRLTAVSPEGDRVGITDGVFNYQRHDVDQFFSGATGGHHAGFIAFLRLTAPSELAQGWVLEMTDDSGAECEVRAPDAITDPIDGRRRILAGLPLEVLPAHELMADHVHPAIAAIQHRLRGLVEIANVRDYGDLPERPDISIIVPLYGRIDFLEHQLAQFVHDPDLRSAELIYVLDSPELAPQLRQRAAQLSLLYPIPFRVVELAHTSGYAAANEAGVAHALGRLLLFLNSDVLPSRPGWVGEMARFYDATEGIGGLGPKLLYEDDALQHAGMYFVLPQDTALAGLWANAHYYKGMHRRLPAACVNRRVPALTGACLMIDHELYREAGGFSDEYVQGDHEDSDLCLRLAALGRESWYVADVELYHLEGQSYPDDLRGRAALYNRWLHTEIWKEALQHADA